MPGRVLVRASQMVTCSSQGPALSPLLVPSTPRAQPLPAPHLLRLCASLKQALLDGKLQQIVVFIAKGLTALCAQHTVSLRHLKHSGVHLARERAPWMWQRGHVQPSAQRPARLVLRDLPPALVPEAVTAGPELGAGTHTELKGSSQPHRLLKVMRAFSTWKRGISEETATHELPWLEVRLCPAPAAHIHPTPFHCPSPPSHRS